MADLLFMFMLTLERLNAYKETIPIFSKYLCPPGQCLASKDILWHNAKVNVRTL